MSKIIKAEKTCTCGGQHFYNLGSNDTFFNLEACVGCGRVYISDEWLKQIKFVHEEEELQRQIREENERRKQEKEKNNNGNQKF